MSTSLSKIFFFLMLFVICTLFWLLQSLSSLSQYYIENGGETTTRRSIMLEESQLPSIVICNRLPYSQTSLAAYGKSMRQEALRTYLREWFDPSTVDSLDFEEMTDDDRQFAESTVAQLLPNTGLKQRLEQILLKCQDFLSSCIIQGVSMSGFNCCENVQPFLATTNGICWIFSNRTFIQESLDSRFGIQLTFQIARNSFVSNTLATHPGVLVYLAAGDESRAAIASGLSKPFNLKDKRQTAVLVEKQVELNRRRKDCERQSWHETYSMVLPQNASATGSLAACLIEASVRECGCVPLIAVLWTLQGDLDPSFLRRFDVSSICSVDEYNRCSRKYMAQSGSMTVKRQKQLRDSVERCRSISKVPCHKTTFRTTQMDEADLPQEYRSTQDFVSKFSIAYDSLEVTEVINEKAMTTRQLLIILGCNFATWFSVGHVIWSLFSWCNDLANRRSKHKVEPRQSMMISSPIQIRPRNKAMLPPLEINGRTGGGNDTKVLHEAKVGPPVEQSRQND